MNITEAVVILVLAFMAFAAFAMWNLRDRPGDKPPMSTLAEIREFARIYEKELWKERGKNE